MKNKQQKHIEAVNKFIEEKGYEPTALDFDNTPYLPSARTIQRIYGGLPLFRLAANLKTMDFTKGKERSAKAKKSMEDCLEDETVLFTDLLKKYGDERVSSPVRVFSSRGITADIRLKIDEVMYLIDIFKPNSVQSFKGCINIKNKKYLIDAERAYPDTPTKFLYVCVNEEVMVPIKNEIPVMSLSEFRKKFLS